MNSKVVWITGASSGIGEALVYEYNKAGARLIISSRNRDELFRVKTNCKNPVNIHVLSLDLENTATLSGKAEEAIRIYGHIDILINSGGISQRGLALETDLETEQRLMNVNFWGTTILSKAVLLNMIANGGGNIVCISSLVGKFGTKMRSAYSASKHALHGYFDSLRSEVYDKKINITIICPGFIKTNVTLNALTANGTPQGTMDAAQENGMLAEDCARKIVQAVKLNKEEVYIGGKEVKGVLFKRLFPLRFSKYLRTAKVT
ncbi:SDR family oxidoreductase [Pedobacter panaciterrae]|jgi:Short-chain dehydrogenases of various substrate specificities|uniref:SDR family oxidoreductase n=1 Tax=Pedobacter panaciterrae TaxID=363849 RepID=A0ABU8NSZ3_9SPHI|nr:SDR family oxidoreductase [Pedobacter panaciterrae]NQX54907.1 SDR family oxidoreductase [Pedobacter panaciterrae]